MCPLVECVPNFSEGRRSEVVEAIVQAITGAAPVHLLDYSSDSDHNRSVVTFVGPPDAVEKAAFAGIAKAAELIDMNQHHGEHPRIGATDVVPFVPIRDITMEECVEMARRLGKRVGEELGIPVYLYEEAATRPERRDLAYIRRGEYEGLKEAIKTDPDRAPDFGPAELGPAGATVIGARHFLIAYNVYLTTDDVEIAKKISRAVRHSSGGLRYVKAMGVLVNGKAQVSMNLTNFRRTPVHRVVEMIRREAARYGVSISHSELIGLIPEAALIDSARWYLQLDGMKEDQVLEVKLSKVMEAGAGASEKAGPSDGALRPIAFLDAVAAGTPTPGGGAVAAMAGALGAALAGMVARLTIGKKRYADVESEMHRLAAKADKLRRRLTDAIELDSRAYDEVMAAYKRPKDDPDRQEAINQALIHAADVPMSVAKMALEAMEIAREVATKGNKNAATDAAAAVHMGMAAVEVAALNVLINARDFADSGLADRYRSQIEGIRRKAQELGHSILTAVGERIEIL